MAEKMRYDVPPTQTEPDANEALGTLLENLHKHGFLRLANDLVCANTQIAKVLVDGLSQPGSQTTVQNILLLLMALSRVPPERFNQLLMALTDGANALSEASQDKQQGKAPGIRGAIKILQDDKLWEAISPLLAGVKSFSAGMAQEADKPITRYSGKKTQEEN